MSMALRVLYHQGIETLMSLLGALVQGPTVVPAWIAKCRTEDSKGIVSRLRTGSALLTENGPMKLSFDILACEVHSYVWLDESDEDSTAAR